MSTSFTDGWSWGRLLAAPAASAMPEPAPRPLGPEPVPEPEWEPEPPPPPRRDTGLTALLMLGLGAAVGAWLYLGQDPVTDFGGGGGGPAGYYNAVTATRGELRETLRVGGSIRAEDYAAIRAPQIRAGRRGGGGGGGAGGGLTLIRMAEPGSVVKKGDVVAEFDRQSQQQLIDDREAQVAQAAALVKSQEANLMIEREETRQKVVAAKAEYEKARLDLRTAEVRSEIEAEILKNRMEEAESSYRQLEMELKLLEASHAAALRQVEIDLQQQQVDLKRADLNTRYMLLPTPIDGIVVLETIFRGGSFAQSPPAMRCIRARCSCRSSIPAR